MAKRLKVIPQPPIDRQKHPTGQRSWWLAALLVMCALIMIGLGPLRSHDAFGDGSVIIPELSLNRAVTLGGPRKPAPKVVVAEKTPANDATVAPTTADTKKTNVENGDDYCAT